MNYCSRPLTYIYTLAELVCFPMDVTPIREPSRWEKRTTMEKRLIIALMLAVVISMALMFALIFARPIIVIAQNSKFSTEEDTCLTAGCIKAAGQILERLDLSVEPCDNFYDFVCGKYIRNTVIPPGKPIVQPLLRNFEKIQQQLRDVIEEPVKRNEIGTTALIKKYYQACMNKTLIEKNGLETLRTLINQIGGWPVLDGDPWNEDEFDWKKLMYKFRETGIDAEWFVVVIVDTDARNSSRYMVKVKQPDFGLRQEYLIKGIEDNFVKAYYDYMVDVAVILGGDKEKAMEELKQSLEFEMKLANFSLSEVQASEVDELYNVLSITELQQKYPNIPWLEYLNTILSNGTQLNTNEMVLLTTPIYISLFEDYIEETPKRIQANYAIWRTIQTLIPFSIEKLRESELKFKQDTMGVLEKLPRWEECMNEATSRLPILAGSLYIQNYFNEKSKESVSEMVGYIRTAFNNTLKTADWMDAETQRNALDKANAVKEQIGYPDELLDKKKVKQIYKEVQIHADQYLQSFLNLNRFAIDFYFSNLRKTVNSSYWVNFANPAMSTARYDSKSNSIVFSAGILQGLFFESDRPNYMNFGAIGSVIGHELTHGFDYSGRTIDKNGMLSDWWAPKAKQLFLSKSKCIVQQYENFTIPEIGQHLNGENTKDENIADNGGVKQAYLAYKAWVKSNNRELKLPGLDYSPNQLFWISYATQWCTVYKTEILKLVVASDTHSPNEFRVVGPLSNSEHFSDDFNCQLGSKMNPRKKCSIW